MADITIDNLPVAISLDGTEFIPVSKNTGSGYVTEKTTTGAVATVAIQASYLLATANISLPSARILSSFSTHITITDGGAGSNLTLDLANSGVTANTYGDSTHIPAVTVDAKGRVTNVTNIDISSPTFVNLTISGHETFNGSTSGATVVQATAVASGTLTLPAATDTLVGKATTDILSNKTLAAPVITGGETLNGATSGATVLQATAVASGTLTLPAATDTLIGKATTDTLTNKTLDTAGAGNVFKIGGVTITSTSGTGSVALTTSPVFTTPNIGAASGTSLNLSGLTASNAVATDASKNLVSVANTGSGSNVLAVSPALTGVPTSPTASQGNNSAQLATTAYVDTGLAASPGRLLAVQVFKASGTYTRTAGATTGILYNIGGGAAGGGAAATGAGTFTAGGGGGSGAMCTIFNLTLPASATVTIGAGGTGVSGASGNNGAATSFNGTATANGGLGGVALGPSAGTFSANGGAGGAVSATGTIDTGGHPGTFGVALAGNIAGGNGGSTMYGSGGLGANIGTGAAAAGGAGTGFGSGGGGAAAGNSQAAQTGGAGTAGISIVLEYR